MPFLEFVGDDPASRPAKATVAEAVMVKLKASLSPEHLVKLTAAVGQANWTNRFNYAFGVELP